MPSETPRNPNQSNDLERLIEMTIYRAIVFSAVTAVAGPLFGALAATALGGDGEGGG